MICVCVLAGVKNVCYILNYAFLIIAQLASIRKVTLANVICRNTDMNEIQRKALLKAIPGLAKLSLSILFTIVQSSVIHFEVAKCSF